MDYLRGSIKNIKDSGNPDWFYDNRGISWNVRHYVRHCD